MKKDEKLNQEILEDIMKVDLNTREVILQLMRTMVEKRRQKDSNRIVREKEMLELMGRLAPGEQEFILGVMRTMVEAPTPEILKY